MQFQNLPHARLRAIVLGGVVGAVVAFIAVGAVDELLWVAGGAAFGAALAWVLARSFREIERDLEALDLADRRTRDELYEEAQRLDIEGRSDMDKGELAEAVLRARA